MSVSISVTSPVTITHNLRKHTVYTVKGWDEDGEFEVLRRYRHFLSLRDYMRDKWPGVLVPGLPPKRLLASFYLGQDEG